METKMTRNLPRVASLLTGIALAVTSTFAVVANASELDDANTKALAQELAPARAQHLAVTWCSSCHGPGGRSVNPIFPNLAGQQKDYIVNQLINFHNLNQWETWQAKNVTHEGYVEMWFKDITGWRKPYTGYVHSNDYKSERTPRNEEKAWDFMKGVARDLDQPTMNALAEFFSKQTPAAPATGEVNGNIAHGQSLFLNGDMSKGLLPCQMCHGPAAAGQGSIPRLASQHADYVYQQLVAIRSGQRQIDQMAALVANLSDQDFKDVAAYVQSLK